MVDITESLVSYLIKRRATSIALFIAASQVSFGVAYASLFVGSLTRGTVVTILVSLLVTLVLWIAALWFSREEV